MKNPAYKDLPSVVKPAQEELDKAVRAINNLRLYFYQILLREGLTSSAYWTNSHFNVCFTDTMSGLRKLISIDHKKYPEFSFDVRWNCTEEELLTKCRLVLDAIKEGKQKEHPVHSCCPLSVQQNCVCTYRQSCPIHGTSCKGTHD